MGKTVSKRHPYKSRRDRDNEDMNGFLRSKQKGPILDGDIRKRSFEKQNSRDWEDYYFSSLAGYFDSIETWDEDGDDEDKPR